MTHTARLALAALTIATVGCGVGDLAVPATTSSSIPLTAPPSTAAVAATSTPVTTQVATTPATVADTLPVPADPPDPAANEPHVVVGTLEIPKIHISKTLLEGVSLGVLDEAPGHWPGTALPGHMGNVVIAGHRTVYDRPFHDIDQLAVGDEVIFTTSEGRYVYRVTSTEIVLPDAMRIIDQTIAHTATLFACHPLGSTRQRIVVHLEEA